MSLFALVSEIWTVNIEYFMLMLIRTGALIISSPLFGRRNIPNRAKIALCFLITIVFYEAFPPEAGLVYANIFEYVLLCLLEFLFGLIMGFVTNLFFTLVFTSGYLADMQIGFGMVNIYDVSSGISAPVTGTLLNLVMLICFFMVNGHLKLITLLYNTFRDIPIGQVRLSADVALAVFNLFCSSFVLAINIAMPFLAVGLVIEAVLGVLIRTIPQMNMFVVGLPIKLMVGLFVLMVAGEAFVGFTDTLFDQMFAGLQIIFNGLKAGIT